MGRNAYTLLYALLDAKHKQMVLTKQLGSAQEHYSYLIFFQPWKIKLGSAI